MRTPSHLLLAALLVLGAPALAQQQPPPQQTQGLSAGAPEVQSTAPETGAGRGGPNAPQPETSEPAAPTGGARPSPAQTTAPQAPTAVEPIRPNVPMNARGGATAFDLERQHDREGGVISGRVTIPNQSAGILIQPDGRDWRQFRNQVLKWAGLIALVGTLLALAIFYAVKGATRIEGGRSGRLVRRYHLLERANHWMVASSFVLLALTGLNITYGAYWLRPIIGPEAFTTITFYGQAVHHYIAWAFAIGVLVMLVHWARDNLPNRVDLAWLRAGGPMAKGHPPAGKFNAGQKGLFWLTTLGGLAITVSGLFIMMPGLLDDVILNQWSHIVHGVLAMGMIAVIFGHIYIGSIGMEGAFEGMRDGHVDYNWAREHHSVWLEEELDRARRSVAPDNIPRRSRVAGAD